jgi:nucleotide-binding universal stress UspA family protein
MELIVCGIDGSETSLRALDWAADEARLRGATLRIVNAWFEPIVVGYPFAGGMAIETEAIEEAARQILRDAMARLHVGDGELTIEEGLVHGTRPPRCCSRPTRPTWSWSAREGAAASPACCSAR